MLCKRCQTPLVKKQTSYCSPRCSKLHLKSLYRKRKKESINKYNREYMALGIRGNPSTNKIIADFKKRNPACAKCESTNIQIGHIKPRNKGGKNRDNLISLCPKHHFAFDNLLREFWKI